MVNKIISFINNEFNKEYNFNNALSNIKLLEDYIKEEFEDIDNDTLLLVLNESKILDDNIKILIRNISYKLKHIIVELYYNDSFIYRVINTYALKHNLLIDNLLVLKENNKLKISDEEMIILIDLAKEGDQEALEKLIDVNAGLIRKGALKYLGKSKYELDDLIQESTIGLIKAIYGFDKTKGYQFSSYALSTIDDVIRKSTNNNGFDVRIPIKKIDKLKKAFAVKKRLTNELGHEPDAEMVAKECNYPVEETKELLAFDMIVVTSINDLTPYNDDQTLEDTIPSDSIVEDDVLDSLYNDYVLNVVRCILSDIEFEVLLYRLGFIDNRIYTLEEIADKYKLTRQRVNQIELSAYEKLRSNRARTLLSEVNHKTNIPGFLKVDINNSESLKPSTIYIKEKSNLFDYFIEYTKEEVLEAVSKLSMNYQNILYKKFGNNLDTLLQVSESNSRLFINEIKPLIQSHLNIIMSNKNRNSALAWFPNSSKEDLIEALKSQLPNNQFIFYKRFGKNLDELNPILSDEKDQLYDIVIPDLQKHLKYKLIENKTIFDYFKDCTQEEVILALNNIPKDYLLLITKKFGKNLNENLYVTKFTEKLLEGKVYSKINYLIVNFRKEDVLFDYFKKNDHNILSETFKKLNAQEQRILYTRYSFNLDCINNINPNALRGLYENVIPKLFNLFNIKFDNTHRIENKKIDYYFPKVTKKELNNAIKMLKPNEQKIVYLRFGNDLDQVNNFNEYILLYYQIFKTIRKNLSYNKRKSIIKNINIDILNEKEILDLEIATDLITKINTDIKTEELLIFILNNGIGTNKYNINDLSKILGLSIDDIYLSIDRVKQNTQISTIYDKLCELLAKNRHQKSLKKSLANK